MLNKEHINTEQFKTIESLLEDKDKLCKIGKTILKFVLESNVNSVQRNLFNNLRDF